MVSKNADATRVDTDFITKSFEIWPVYVCINTMGVCVGRGTINIHKTFK